MMAGNELEKTLKKDIQEFTVRDADNVMGFLVRIPNIISYAIKNGQVAEMKEIFAGACDILRKLDAMKSIPKPLAYMTCSPAYLDDDVLKNICMMCGTNIATAISSILSTRLCCLTESAMRRWTEFLFMARR
jgi:hypothetical protein